MPKELSLTALQKDALREIASIGVSHAATALSKMINKKVLIDVPQVNILPLNKLPELLAPTNELIVGVYFKVLGKASGKVLISFKKESSLMLADVLMRKKIGDTKILAEMEQSAIKELAAISTSVCLNALAELLNMTLLPSIPHFTYDYAKSVVDLIFEDVFNTTEYMVVVDSEFRESNNKIIGRFLIFPDDHAFDAIWKTLRLREGERRK